MQEEKEDTDSNNSTLSSALEEEDLEKVVIENSLGSDLYLRTFKDDFQKVTVLAMEQTSFVRLPPPKFPDKFMTGTDTRPNRHYVVVHVAEAKVPFPPATYGSLPLCLKIVAYVHESASMSPTNMYVL